MVAIGARLLPACWFSRRCRGWLSPGAGTTGSAAHPTGSACGPFADFRFNDQLVWLVVVCSAAFVLPIPAGDPRRAWDNLPSSASALYAARGAAVVWGRSAVPFGLAARDPGGRAVPLAGRAGRCFALGLADTWLDFRRRFPPPHRGGVIHGSDPAGRREVARARPASW